MTRLAAGCLVACAACSGPAKPPLADLPKTVAPMVVPPAPLEPAMPPYGARDAAGRPDGEWAFDCDGIAQGCHAWFEHGVQVMWSRVTGGERFVIDARDGGWRWQWWSGDVLRGQAGLPFEPAAWTPGETVQFPATSPPPQGPCSGPFMVRDANGALSSDGTCDGGQWTEWRTYDPFTGRVTSASRRDADGSDSQSFDATGKLASRVQVDNGLETSETWYPDGTPWSRYVRKDSTPIENRTWYPDGTPMEVDVTTGRDRTDRRYTTTGVMIAESTWTDGAPNGTWRSWYPSGAKRSSVHYRPTATPGPVTVWDRRGKKLATADLGAQRWSDGKKRGTHIAAARITGGQDRVGIDGGKDCRATDKPCVRELAATVFSPIMCLYPNLDDPLWVWRGTIRVTVGFERNGASGITAARDTDGLPPGVLECLNVGGVPREFSQHVEVTVDVDLLIAPEVPKALMPRPELDDPL